MRVQSPFCQILEKEIFLDSKPGVHAGQEKCWPIAKCHPPVSFKAGTAIGKTFNLIVKVLPKTTFLHLLQQGFGIGSG